MEESNSLCQQMPARSSSVQNNSDSSRRRTVLPEGKMAIRRHNVVALGCIRTFRALYVPLL